MQGGGNNQPGRVNCAYANIALLCIIMQLGKENHKKGNVLRFYTEKHYAHREK